MFWSDTVKMKYYPGVSCFIVHKWWNCTIGNQLFAVNGIKGLERILKSCELDRIVLEPWELDAKDNRTET